MRARPLKLACLALGIAAAVLIPAPARAATPVDYVALGDSYSSGVGAGPYDPFSGLCFRSSKSYPPLWANRNPVSSFRFVACGGATTDDVLAHQIGALNAGTDLVTISIGGNDAGFARVMITCVLATDAACLDAIADGRTYVNQTLPGRLDATYAAIRQRAPRATVIVLGYPRLVETGPCPGGMSMTKRVALNEGADVLAGVIAARARAAGFLFADSRSHFAGHGICGATPWINDFSLLHLVESFHPNAAGYASGYLPALITALR